MTDSMRMASLDELRQRTSVKWRQHPPDVLPLTVAEMDTMLSAPVVEAVQRALAIGDTGYPAGTGYAEALADFAAARWDLKIDIDRTGIVPDVMLGIVEVLKLVTGPGDFVVVNSPVYEPFYLFLTHLDRHVLEAPLDDDHRIDLVTLESAFVQATAGGRSAAYLLCSPHNPTGTVHRRDELDALLALAREYGVRIVVDEIHAPLTYPGATYLPFLSLPGSEDAFSLMSASKAWNLAGLRAALVIAGVGAAADLARMPVEVSHGASHIGVIAHTAAFTSGRAWLDELLAQLDKNRMLLAELLRDELPQVRYSVPQGTFLAWLDCRALGLGDDPAAAFLERGRVALVSGPNFGTGGAGHVRLNLATSPEILREAVHRMATSLT